MGTDGFALEPSPSDAWTEEAKTLWEARVRALHESKELRLIEAPDYKRRWAITPKDMAGRVLTFHDRSSEYFENWMADECESFVKRVCGQSLIASARGLAEACASDSAFVAISTVAHQDDAGTIARQILLAESVPFLASMRHTSKGLEVRAQWEATWDLQRQEDAGDDVGEIPVPPKYARGDYRSDRYFELRGKLDVPKERFISYPGCESDEDHEPVYGWAGWDHLQRAQALAALYQDRKDREGWTADRLTPMLAGLLELLPWLLQWHNEPSEEFDGLQLGDYFQSYLDEQWRELGLTHDDLRNWRPPEKKRGGRGRKKA